MTKSELSTLIVKELKECHAGKWVVPLVALAKCPQPYILTALDALDDLVTGAVIERRMVKGFPTYRWCPKKPVLTLHQGGKS